MIGIPYCPVKETFHLQSSLHELSKSSCIFQVVALLSCDDPQGTAPPPDLIPSCPLKEPWLQGPVSPEMPASTMNGSFSHTGTTTYCFSNKTKQKPTNSISSRSCPISPLPSLKISLKFCSQLFLPFPHSLLFPWSS